MSSPRPRPCAAPLLLLLALSVLTGCPAAPPSPPPPDAGPGAAPDAGSPPDAGVLPEPFEVVAFDDVRISSLSGEPNFQNAFAAIDWGTFPKARVTLKVSLRSTCYPFDGWAQNPPPQGESWPADCDAFDRNFEFVLDPPEAAGDPPGVELVRAITPFGGPLEFEVDVTDVANGLPGAHTLQVHITTWSDASGAVSGSAGGWNVSASVEVVPGEAPRKVLAVIPLFNGNVTTGGDGPELSFELPEGTLISHLDYRATGHGGGAVTSGCIGPAEEFCKRTHTLFADGVEADAFDPWRTDCDQLCTLATHTWPSGSSFQYCEENPCGALSSVRAPRANWCPGSVTEPWPLEPVAWTTAGPHSFRWNISRVEQGGSWRVSAHVFAYGL